MARLSEGELRGAGADWALRQQPPVTAEDVLAAQKRSLELVVRGAPVEQVLAELARIVEEAAPDTALASILVVDPDGRLKTMAAPSLPAPFNAAIDQLERSDFGSFAMAAATGVTAVTQDMTADDSWKPVRLLAQELGLRAAWSHPIVTQDDRLLGAFATYFREYRRPSAYELRLVETLSQTAALALARHESEAAMARQRRTLDLAMEAAEMGAWRYTVSDDICMYDERAQRLYGLDDGRFPHDDAGVQRLIHPDDQARMWKAVGAAIDPNGDGRYNVEYRVRQKDGSWRWLSAWGIVEFEGEGAERRPAAIAGSSRDINAPKLAEEHQRLLVNELNHRVKNTLATVQSIAQYTLRTAEDPATMREAIDSRILSMARAHDLLTTHSWAGAELGAVVARAIEPFTAARFETGGPALQMSAQQVLALSMALHELATNAVKHGALACAEGRVHVTWLLDEEKVTFAWRERGGAPVVPPKRRGFGSRLLEQAIAHELDGVSRIEYAAEGVLWETCFPLHAPSRS